jgi:nucleoside-diphosphate-sugar epimerase
MLITGGAGFIGTHLIEALRQEYDIVVLDNYRRNSLHYVPNLAGLAGVRIVQGDVLDLESVARAMTGADVVLHLAAIAGVSSYYKEPLTTLRVNILGTINVLEAMRRTGARRIVDFSTSEVYGTQANGVDEEVPHGIGPVSQRRWVYAVSKLASEHFTLRYGEEYGLEAVCVRPFNIYGPRQTGEGCISNFCSNLIAGKPLQIHGAGEDIRAWCYVSDMVEAIRLILKTPEAAGKTFNIGNPTQAASTAELAQILLKIHGRGEIQHIPAPHNPIPARVPNIDRAATLLRFEPKVTLVDGLTQTLRWYREVWACAS